jgi:hypothetical protein
MHARFSTIRFALFCILAGWLHPGSSSRGADGPETPRIDSVVMATAQPQASAEAVIWYDDFNGSPVDQSRWINNFVISAQPIGPIVCPRNPLLIKTPYFGPGKLATWQVEVASADQPDSVVWQSQLLTGRERVEVDADHGRFVGPLANKSQLDAGRIYYFRVRQSSDSGQTSPWSPWHQAVKTVD